MSSINFYTKEISVKIVYYGPGLCGKTSSLYWIYNSLPKEQRPQLVSLATEVDRTIFFDFLPLTAYKIRDFKVRLQLYTVPGQVFYNATRKLVLNGVDGIIFVADSQRGMRDSNLESLQNLEENLNELGMEIHEVPLVIACNKRDLGDIETMEEMDQLYNKSGVPIFATVATTGQGVLDALRAVSQLLINNLIKKGLGTQIETVGGTPLSGGAAGAGQDAANPGPPPPAPPSTSVTISAPPSGPQAIAGPPPPAPGEGLAQVAARASHDRARALLWPPGNTADIGQRIETAIAAQRFADAVRETERLLRDAASRWSVAAGEDLPEPLPTYLLLRGVSGARYRTFSQALEAASAGHDITRTEAMNGLILALEAVW